MTLNEYHRRLLGMRTYLGKFAIQVGYKGDQNLLDALQDLLDHNYINHIDVYFNREVNRWLNVYKLTDMGEELVEDEDIVAVSP